MINKLEGSIILPPFKKNDPSFFGNTLIPAFHVTCLSHKIKGHFGTFDITLV